MIINYNKNKKKHCRIKVILYLWRNKKIIEMATIKEFKAADKKVSEIESRNFEVYNPETDSYEVSKEYKEALEYSQKLYNELMAEGINPFA